MARSSGAPASSAAAPAATWPLAPPQTQVPPEARTPTAVLTVFALAYTNWTAQTVTRNMRMLAAASLGQARSAMELAANRTAGDYELRRSGIANEGQVEAIAPLAHRRNQYVVVTLERTTATRTDAYQGLRPGWHLTVATVTPFRGGWLVSRWEPEN